MGSYVHKYLITLYVARPTKDTTSARLPLILNQAASALAEPVHHLFSLCLSKSYHVTPIHKSGDRSIYKKLKRFLSKSKGCSDEEIYHWFTM